MAFISFKLELYDLLSKSEGRNIKDIAEDIQAIVIKRYLSADDEDTSGMQRFAEAFSDNS